MNSKNTKKASCHKCAWCCKNLNWFYRIYITISTRRPMFKRNCKFLTKNNLCSIYKKRPTWCRKFFCEDFINSGKF